MPLAFLASWETVVSHQQQRHCSLYLHWEWCDTFWNVAKCSQKHLHYRIYSCDESTFFPLFFLLILNGVFITQYLSVKRKYKRGKRERKDTRIKAQARINTIFCAAMCPYKFVSKVALVECYLHALVVVSFLHKNFLAVFPLQYWWYVHHTGDKEAKFQLLPYLHDYWSTRMLVDPQKWGSSKKKTCIRQSKVVISTFINSNNDLILLSSLVCQKMGKISL